MDNRPLAFQTDEDGWCMCDGGGSIRHRPMVRCTTYHPALHDELYDFRAPAVDNMTKNCPGCGSKGFNRIWDCGSMITSGRFEQGKNCKVKIIHAGTIGADDEDDGT